MNYINMSTLQYKYIRMMGLKTRYKQSLYCTWWGVPKVNMKHMPLPILYRGTVMDTLHNAEVNCLLGQ